MSVNRQYASAVAEGRVVLWRRCDRVCGSTMFVVPPHQLGRRTMLYQVTPSHHQYRHVSERFLLNQAYTGVSKCLPLQSMKRTTLLERCCHHRYDRLCDRTKQNSLVTIQRKSFWSKVTTAATNTGPSTTTSTTINEDQQKLVLSKYDTVDLEEHIYARVTNVLCDPVLRTKTLSSLQWLQKRIGISYSYEHSDKESTKPSTTTIILQLPLRLPSLLHPKLKELQTMIQERTAEQARQWLIQHNKLGINNEPNVVVVRVEVIPMVQPPVPIMSRFVDDATELLYNLGPGLTSVAHTIAVYSCKGGVGKSTVAVNLAYELAAAGGRVGLCDLDLYGPSLPVLVRPTDCTIRRSPLGTGLVYPITHDNVKLLSLGFVNTNSGVPGSGVNNGASIMKGPMAVKVVSQLLKGTDWGALDVLVLDLPPGTGDVQLAVLQQLQLSGAIAVSTPSKLATADTRKGIEMFTSLGVPTIAVVENMSYFDDDTGKRHYPFGNGFMDPQQIQKSFVSDVPVNVVQLPISMATNDANECGIPLTISRPATAVKELSAYKILSNIVSEELLRLQYGASSNDEAVELVSFSAATNEEICTFDVANVSLHLDKTKGNEKLIVRIFSDTNALQFTISSPSDLRSRDPKTGDIMTDSPHITKSTTPDNNDGPTVVVKVTKRSPSVIPIKVERRGRYGFAVEWADGATIIYSMRCLAKAAGGELKTKRE